MGKLTQQLWPLIEFQKSSTEYMEVNAAIKAGFEGLDRWFI